MSKSNLESLELKELNNEKQIQKKHRKSILVIWTILFILAVLTVFWRFQQGTDFSESAPLIVILLCARIGMTYGVDKKLKQIENELQKRS